MPILLEGVGKDEDDTGADSCGGSYSSAKRVEGLAEIHVFGVCRPRTFTRDIGHEML